MTVFACWSRLPTRGAILLVLLAGSAGALAGEAERGATGELERALALLQSPAQKTRRLAVRQLIRGLPASRPLVLAALENAPPEVKVSLVEVLARDGSPPAMRALLAELRGSDPLTAARIRRRLVRDPKSTRRVLDAWSEAPELREGEGGRIHERVVELERLLERAEVERLFLSRKSRTGTTGSYRGQYDVLKPHLERALELFVGILLDRALPEPGVYTTGKFAFLRPPPIHIDMDELRSMAAHAFSEIARPADRQPMRELADHLPILRRRIEDANRSDDMAFLEHLGQYSDLVVALYLVDKDQPVGGNPGDPGVWSSTAERALAELLAELDVHGSWRLWNLPSHRAIVLLRVGRHREAISEFDQLLGSGRAPSLAGTYYNMACAYAQWGAQLGDERGRTQLDLALSCLEKAVDEQWSDVGWLDEDRDLDPIRDTPGFRALRARVLREITPDEGDGR